jgi:hypothetical protein
VNTRSPNSARTPSSRKESASRLGKLQQDSETVSEREQHENPRARSFLTTRVAPWSIHAPCSPIARIGGAPWICRCLLPNPRRTMRCLASHTGRRKLRDVNEFAYLMIGGGMGGIFSDITQDDRSKSMKMSAFS